jgi:hypothetical protein
MMHLEPSKRITVKAAMEHPFFKDHSKIGTTLPMISPQKARTSKIQRQSFRKGM